MNIGELIDLVDRHESEGIPIERLNGNYWVTVTDIDSIDLRDMIRLKPSNSGIFVVKRIDGTYTNKVYTNSLEAIDKNRIEGCRLMRFVQDHSYQEVVLKRTGKILTFGNREFNH